MLNQVRYGNTILGFRPPLQKKCMNSFRRFILSSAVCHELPDMFRHPNPLQPDSHKTICCSTTTQARTNCSTFRIGLLPLPQNRRISLIVQHWSKKSGRQKFSCSWSDKSIMVVCLGLLINWTRIYQFYLSFQR